jgi:hypothetical protein
MMGDHIFAHDNWPGGEAEFPVRFRDLTRKHGLIFFQGRYANEEEWSERKSRDLQVER